MVFPARARFLVVGLAARMRLLVFGFATRACFLALRGMKGNEVGSPMGRSSTLKAFAVKNGASVAQRQFCAFNQCEIDLGRGSPRPCRERGEGEGFFKATDGFETSNRSPYSSPLPKAEAFTVFLNTDNQRTLRQIATDTGRDERPIHSFVSYSAQTFSSTGWARRRSRHRNGVSKKNKQGWQAI